MHRVAIACALSACLPPSSDGFAQPQYAPPPPAYAAPEAIQPAGLRCGELLAQCYRCTDGADCAARCVQSRGTPRAQWLHLAIAACAQVQGCRVGWCVEQGCVKQMAACRGDTADATAEASPIGLDGEWSYGGVSLVGFYSPTAGWSPSSSSGGSYKFTNGHYEHGILLESRTYTCGMGAFGWSTGRYTVDGDRLTLIEEQSRVKSANGCGGTAATHDAPLETHTYTMQFLPDELSGEPRLVLSENGKPISNPYAHR